jgi:rod shape-determining protein MreC
MPRPAVLLHRYRDRGLLLLCVILAFVLRSSSEEFRFQFVRRVATVFYAPSDGLTWLGHTLGQWGFENEDLRARLRDQEHQWAHIQEVRRENERLRGILGFASSEAYQFLPAELLSYPLSFQDRNLVRIDKGSAQGLEVGMPVVGYEGLVGRVEFVEPHRSQVLLLSSKTFTLGARNLRSRVLGAFKWNPRLGFHVDRVDPGEDVQVGDRFITSGLGHEFPGGFLLGTVREVKHTPGSLRMEILIRPAASLSSLENIFVVTRVGEDAAGFPHDTEAVEEGEAP